MSCPPAETLARLIAEDLPLAEARDLERHLEGCTACAEKRAQTAALVAGLAGPLPGLDRDGSRFVAGVVDRLDRPSRRRVPWRLVAAAALVLLVLPVSYLGLRHAREPGRFTPRGARPSSSPAVLETLVGVEPLRARGAAFVPLRAGARLSAADGLAFRYDNLSREQLYLLAFALDREGEVHWFYPAYLSASSDPLGVPLAAGVRGRLLPEVTRPEGVPPGPLRVVTVVGRRRVSVKQAERRLAGHDPGRPVAPLFPGAATEEWTVQMEGGDVR